MKNQFSVQDVSAFYGHPKRTTENHIKKLKERGLFNKTAIGRYYNLADVRTLSMLLNFQLPKPPQTTT